LSLIDVVALPFSYWVGMETDPRTTPDALAEFNRFYSTTHVHEVIAAHPGFVAASRYELVDPASSAAAPRWLAVYGMADEAAAEQYIKDNARPWLHRSKYSPWPPARKRAKITWRMLWRRGNSAGSLTSPAERMTLVRLNSAPDTVALPEGATRATSMEIYRAFAPAPPEAPAFCVLYEGEPKKPPATESFAALHYRYIPPPV